MVCITSSVEAAASPLLIVSERCDRIDQRSIRSNKCYRCYNFLNIMMKTLILGFGLASASLFAQYTIHAGGAAPASVPSEFAGMLEKKGSKLMKGGKEVGEFWFRASLPQVAKPSEPNTTLGVTHGSLLGVVEFAVAHADRRGQQIKPGVYTLRYSYFPENGDHQGAAPQRDFMLLTPIKLDKDPNATPNFETIVDWSRKASGTPHPCVLSFWKEDPKGFKGTKLEPQGEHDFVLIHKMGETVFSIILVGKAEG